MILTFRIQGKVLTKVNYQQATNNVNINKCKFYFDERTWEGLEIFVVFENNYGYSTIVPLGKYTEVLSCTIPSRIITTKYFKMFVYAKDSFKTNTIFVMSKESCKTKPQRTTALNDVIDELKTKIDNIYFDENQLKCYADGKLVDTIYIDNVDKVLIEERVQESLGPFKEDINKQIEKCVKIDDIEFSDGIIKFK